MTRSVEIPEEALAEAMDAYYSEGQYGREADRESMRAALKAFASYLNRGRVVQDEAIVTKSDAEPRIIWHQTGLGELHDRTTCSVAKCGREALGSWLRGTHAAREDADL